MPRKTPGNPKSRRLKQLAWKLIDRLEAALDQDFDPSSANADTQLRHDRLFGNKHSLTATLVTLCDLILKLEQAERVQDTHGMMENVAPNEALTPADIQLVHYFLGKQHPVEP